MISSAILSSMIPNKSNFKFQELTPITGVKPYVIRFWETEFSDIAPVVSDSGQKLYARKDIEAILRIKKFLFEQKMSIPEAKLAMQSEHSSALSESPIDRHSHSANHDHHDVKTHLTDALKLVQEIKLKRKW